MSRTITCLALYSAGLSHLFGMPWENILSFVKELAWPQLYYYAMSVEKFLKFRKNHTLVLMSQMKPIWNSKDNMSSKTNFTTVKSANFTAKFSFLKCPVNCIYSGVLLVIKDLGVVKLITSHYMLSSSFESQYYINFLCM